MHRVVVRFLVPVALLALTAGCGGGDPEPEPTPIIASSTSTPTPTPSETAAAEEAPEEFIERFFEANQVLRDTGEAKPMLALTQKCNSCDSMADGVSAMYESGGAIEGEPWTVDSIRQRGDASRVQNFDVNVDIPSSRSRSSATAAWSKRPGGLATIDLQLRKSRGGGEWRVVTFTVVSE